LLITTSKRADVALLEGDARIPAASPLQLLPGEVDADDPGHAGCRRSRHVPRARGHVEDVVAVTEVDRVEQRADGPGRDSREVVVVLGAHRRVFPATALEVAERFSHPGHLLPSSCT